MRAIRCYAFLRVSFRDSRASMLSANYHTALATTLILIRLSVRRDLQTFVSSITQATVRNASRGRRDLIQRWPKWNLPAQNQISLLSKKQNAPRRLTD